MKHVYTRYLIIVISMLSVFGYSQSNTMYYMGTAPQSYFLNPATQPKCGFFIGNSNFISIANTGFSPSDLFWYNSDIDSVIQPFHPSTSITDFLDKMDKTENISSETGLSIISFGFRAGEMYFAFDASLHTSERLVYPKSLLKFVLAGNENEEVFDFSDLGFEALAYTEFSLDISRQFGDMLSVGIRPRLLYGLGTFSTQNNNTTLSTSFEQWNLNADFENRVAITGLSLPVDENGNFDLNGDYNFDSAYSSPSAIRKAFGKNKGFAIDLGMHFRPVDQIQFSFSALDLGYINWKSNTHISAYNGSYTYRGARWNLSDSGNWADKAMDTLREHLNLTNSTGNFKTSLHPKIYAGGRIFLTPGFDVGLLSRTEFLPEKVDQDFILVADLHPVNAFSLSASYSLLGKGHTSLGLGLGLKIGPLNSYFIFDNIPLVYDYISSEDLPGKIPVPANFYKFNMRIGFNLVFGCNRFKKLSQDKPLLNSTNWML